MKYLVPILLFLIISCNNQEKTTEKEPSDSGEYVEISYAKGFEIQEFETYTILKVLSPWPNADKDFTYLLVKESDKIPSDIEFDHQIQIPVKNVVVTSTTHIPTLEALNEESTLKGFPGLDYISSVKTRKLINQNKIRELGKNESINTESLIDISPDVVIGFAIDGNNKTFETIQKTGIPVVYNADWTEESPLGKAEWIKFFGALYDKDDEAKALFNTIEQSYIQAKELAKTAVRSPKILSGSMYRDQWYLPYGNSWQSQFIKDANAQYIYEETEGDGSLAYSFEKVLSDASNADFWIGSGHFESYEQLLNESIHYNQFKAVNEKQVYGISNVKGETGGILYFELAPHRPDLVLKDLISIFHPNLLPEYKTTFFKPLQ